MNINRHTRDQFNQLHPRPKNLNQYEELVASHHYFDLYRTPASAPYESTITGESIPTFRVVDTRSLHDNYGRIGNQALLSCDLEGRQFSVTIAGTEPAEIPLRIALGAAEKFADLITHQGVVIRSVTGPGKPVTISVDGGHYCNPRLHPNHPVTPITAGDALGLPVGTPYRTVNADGGLSPVLVTTTIVTVNTNYDIRVNNRQLDQPVSDPTTSIIDKDTVLFILTPVSAEVVPVPEIPDEPIDHRELSTRHLGAVVTVRTVSGISYRGALLDVAHGPDPAHAWGTVTRVRIATPGAVNPVSPPELLVDNEPVRF